MEIERKYIVVGNEWRKDVIEAVQICQGYLSNDHHCSVRVRTRDDKAYLTIKSASYDNGLSREEYEYEIPFNDASRLLMLCHDTPIHKTRHLIPIDIQDGELTTKGYIELDEFLDDNSGLVVAEVELPSTTATFIKPNYLAEEVTGVEKYYNQFLSQHPYRTWF